ncbi:MAG: hypothetical protein ACOYXA_16080 [Bacteroidota bacterium]
MRRWLTIACVAVALQAAAQEFPFEYWHEGKMVLEGGDTLRGLVKYNLQTDLLQLQGNNTIETYTARKVLFFEIFDQTVKRYRQFFSLPYSANTDYKAPVFFELLEEGKLTVLCREALEYRTISSFYYYGTYTRLVLVNKYFLLDEDGTIIEFQGKKNDWLYLMGKHSEDVQKYARTNRLDFDDKYELGKIIAYYNSLQKK